MTNSIIQEYKDLTENIATIESHIKTIKREIQKLMMVWRPQGLTAINYENPFIQESRSQMEAYEAYLKLCKYERETSDLKKELNLLYNQRNELEKIIDAFRDVEKKALMLRIKGYSNSKIAKEMSYSQRHIERIFKNIREKEKMSVKCRSDMC